MSNIILLTTKLFNEISTLVTEAKRNVTVAVNASLTSMYWHIGKRLNQEALKGERAEYGKEIVITLARQLTETFGRGFSEKQIRRMMQFADQFSDYEIVAALMRQLSWTHFTVLIPLKDPLKREFYGHMCRIEGWSVRGLAERINSMLYERTALSKKPETLIRQ